MSLLTPRETLSSFHLVSADMYRQPLGRPLRRLVAVQVVPRYRTKAVLAPSVPPPSAPKKLPQLSDLAPCPYRLAVS